ncbi:MAG: helix-turn-helix domain-containing protein [Acidovorax sp.]|uniref:helix-turn-helix domain-containing protein n=1 Tax=Acidovorax sp. TaxID=1872122 RepID=UPI0039196143
MSEAIGRRIAEARQKAGLSQAELGEHTGIAQTQISRYESGRAVPRRASLMRLAEALKVQADWLMNGEAVSWPDPISMQVRTAGSKAPAEELVIPPYCVDFVRRMAERLGGSVPDAIVEIIKRYMVEITFAPSGHPKIPHLGALITEHTDLELRVEDLAAELAALKREAASVLNSPSGVTPSQPKTPSPDPTTKPS